MPYCSVCCYDKARTHFSRNQLRKIAEQRRCLTCVLPASSAALDEEPTSAEDEFDTLPPPFSIVVVRNVTSKGYKYLAAEAAACSYAAFDAEWVPDGKDVVGTGHPPSLLQLAFSHSANVYIVQLAMCPLPPEVYALFANPLIPKFGWGLSADLKKLPLVGLCVNANVVDLQWERGVGLGTACSMTLGLEMPLKTKANAISNWGARRLTNRQRIYAAWDAVVVREIAVCLGMAW